MSKSAKGKASKKKASSRPAKVAKTKKVSEEPAADKSKKVAPKPKKPSEQESPRPVGKQEVLNLGPPPTAKVEARHIDSLQERAGRGFSFGELASASISLVSAKRHGLALDIRRRSIVERNVESLKSWSNTPAPTPAKVKAEAPPPAKKK